MQGHRYRCYPTLTQEQTLLRWIGCQRFVYNAKVDEDRYFQVFAHKSLALVGQRAPIDQKYKQFKTELTPWLSDVPSEVVRVGATRWYQAYVRFFKKLAKRPTKRRKGGQQGLWLTRKLFKFKDDGQKGTRLIIGTKKYPVGELRYVGNERHAAPKSIHLSIEAGRWYVSFVTDDELAYPRPDEIQTELSTWSEDELMAATVGVDRGVVNPAYASTGQQFDFYPVQKRRIKKHQQKSQRWQRRLARRVKGSAGWHKAQAKLARTYTYATNVRRDFAHKTSHALVSTSSARLVVMEDLKVQAMTRRPRPKQDDKGKWLPNGARAKARLNQLILNSAWGRVRLYCQYKAPRHNTLFLVVPSQHSSQECAECGYIHPDNRVSQSRFVCKNCGHADNADHNASRVIALRGVRAVRGKEG